MYSHLIFFSNLFIYLHLYFQDEGFDGQVYERPDGADRVHMQRAKFINAKKQNELEKSKREKAAKDKLVAEHLEYERVEAKLKGSRDVVSALLQEQGRLADAAANASTSRHRRGGNQRALAAVSVENMISAKMEGKKISAGQWKNLILIRKYDTERRPKNDKFKMPNNLWPPGGRASQNAAAIQDCIDRGEHSACLYSLAFEYLPKPVLLKSLPSPAPMESIANASVQSVLSVDVDHIEANGLIDSFPPQKPSSLSNPADWFGWIDGIIMGVNEGAADEEAIDLADHLFSLMKTRHLVFERTELTEKEVDTNAAPVCMQFFRENLHLFAILHSAYKQVKSDLSYESDSTCLLRKDDDAFVAISGVLMELEGIYLYRDVINKIDPRGGKTNGKNGPSPKATFGGRDKTHVENAKKKSLDGGVYSKYASVHATAICAASAIGGGRWETHLRQCCVFGFDRKTMTAEHKSKLLPNKPDSTVFVWSKPVMDYLEAYSKRNNVALADIQFTMLMYGMEHSLKLLLAKDHNLSGTKGFENFMVPQLDSE